MKLLSEFHVHSITADGLAGKCKACRKVDRDEWKRQNPERVRQYQRKRQTAWKIATGTVIYEYLLEHPCVDCGEQDPRVLDFDHIPELGVKMEAVAKLLSLSRPLGVILAEIAKCEVRCRNCHMIRTHEVNNSWRHQIWASRARAT